MSDDILDTIDDLLDDVEVEDTVEWGDDIDVVLDTESVLSVSEAEELTAAIRSTVTATYILLAEAHDKKAFKAMGYETWADYVRDEFDISPQRSYQLLDLSKTIKIIEESAPDGTEVKLTEAQARDIKRELPKITERISEETEGLSADEAGALVGEIIDDSRQQMKDDAKAEKERQAKLDEAEKDGYQKGLEAAGDAFLENNGDSPDNYDSETQDENYSADAQNVMSDSADGGFVEMDVDGSGEELSSADSMNLYQFVNSLTGIDSLPEPDDFIKIIPESRFGELYDQVSATAPWMNRLLTLMELKKDS